MGQLTKRNICRFVVLVCVLLAPGALLYNGCGPHAIVTPLQATESIRSTYESSLAGFDSDVQRHYAVRMYRITGDTAYIPLIMSNLKVRLSELREDIQLAGNQTEIEARSEELRSKLNSASRKGRLRVEMFEDHGEIDFYLNLLYNTSLLQEFCLDTSIDYRTDFDQAVAILGEVIWSDFLLDTAVIRVFSPQVINYVYYLLDLGIVDLRERYEGRFKTVFPDDRDDELYRSQYMDKIYGLTHFITSASRYYQQPVDSLEFDWIFEYFARNRDRIIEETKADIIAEVGVCYLLAGYQDHPMVASCRESIVESFDQARGIIPSTTGTADLELGEHRNVLAYMLLRWPGKLWSGPCSEFSALTQ